MMGGAQLVGRWVESYTGMSTDNIKGLLLALSSSLFIGASFIVKKKGLKKAAASGVRAGEGPSVSSGTGSAWDYAFVQQDAAMLSFAAGVLCLPLRSECLAGWISVVVSVGPRLRVQLGLGA